MLFRFRSGFNAGLIFSGALTILLLGSSISFAPSVNARPSTADPRDLELLQGYLDPAPGGMDVRYAWTIPGGRGEGVRIIDIEVDWNLSHSELIDKTSSLLIYVKGVDQRPDLNMDHGTAVLGEIVASDDGVGITGIANEARLGLINPLKNDGSIQVADAIDRAASALRPGDVILIEQQTVGPRFDPLTGRGLAPVEYEPAVFDAIRAATNLGIIVVEPAANGLDNLDDAAYRGAFDRTHDSGAIIVGAGMPPEGQFGPGPDLAATDESNYGSRLDVQGWGRSIVSAGYGDLRRQGQNNTYTDSFGGTSGAAAMIAGAAACIEGIIKARGRAPLSPVQLRQLLFTTGTPESPDVSRRVGRRPDLKAAIAALDSPPEAPVPEISNASYSESKGRLTIDGRNFIPGESVVEIDGTMVRKAKYPAGFYELDGTTSRIITKGDITDLLPRGVTVSLTIFTPSSGKRSIVFPFRRD